MTKHSWHDEIVAWAGGAEIEYRYKNRKDNEDDWDGIDLIPDWEDLNFVYRIKPQPKQPKFLYVVKNGWKFELVHECEKELCYGKIEVQDD